MHRADRRGVAGAQAVIDAAGNRVAGAGGEALHERALHGILGVGAVAEQPIGDGVQASGVLFGQALERPLVHLD